MFIPGSIEAIPAWFAYGPLGDASRFKPEHGVVQARKVRSPAPSRLKATDEEGQWVDYVFYNPQIDDGGTKHTWAIRRDNLIFASGWYEDSYPSPPPTKAEPGSYTQAFVEDAVWFYESNGRDALIEHYNTTTAPIRPVWMTSGTGS